MPLIFQPTPGAILVCDYSGSVQPEMTKLRPVVVLSPKFKNRHDLCAVVPLSTSAPNPIEAYHYELTLNPPLPAPFDSPQMWVKGDMMATVSHQRLDLVRTGRVMGKRTYVNRLVPQQDLQAIYAAVLHGLGLGRLTPHL